MAMSCKQCGAELLPEMRFCRHCGRPTGLLPVTESETQHFPTAGVESAGGMTGPGYTPAQSYPSTQPRPIRRRRVWPWFLGGFFAIAFGAAAAVGIIFYHYRDELPTKISLTEEGAKITTKAGEEIIIPPGPPGGGNLRQTRTVKTDRFRLSEGQELGISGLAGQVTISAWDEDDAEVKFIKRQGDLASRENVNTMILSAGKTVTLKAEAPGGSSVTVDYEVKLPRNLNLSYSLVTASGPIKVTGTSGSVHARSASGDVHIEGHTGSVVAKTVSGGIDVLLPSLRAGQPIDLGSVSGDIRFGVKDGFNAYLDLRTISGAVKTDPSIELEGGERILGHRFRGRVGASGPPINLRTVSGDISLER